MVLTGCRRRPFPFSRGSRDIDVVDHSSGQPTSQTVGQERTRICSTPFSFQITEFRSQTGKNSPDGGWGRVPDFSADRSSPSAPDRNGVRLNSRSVRLRQNKERHPDGTAAFRNLKTKRWSIELATSAPTKGPHPLVQYRERLEHRKPVGFSMLEHAITSISSGDMLGKSVGFQRAPARWIDSRHQKPKPD